MMGQTMKKFSILLMLSATAWAADVPWQVQLKYIEACSCNLFCPCYFTHQASHQHGGGHMCTFNMATRVQEGKHGNVDLKGMKFWLSGDLGTEWGTKGEADWLVVTFEPSATKEQRDGLISVLTKLYPVNWKSFQTDESEISWMISPDQKKAHAKLGNGKGEITLTRFNGPDPSKPTQVGNLKYFAATWNSPFDLYFSDHYYKGFGKDYELKQANGFTIVVEASSDGKRVLATGGAKKAD
jgi:hypothetical protein